MASITLGSIEKVGLREVWKHEALDFTRWLAREENLSLLGDAVGIDLELQETESAVGGFSVDIFATESGTGKRIVIENQLEETNHDHLGKIITYAAGKGAQCVIWVVARARDEHRQAIEWLNQHTDEDSSFFLVEIEVWRIGDSLPAPRFNVVESPNEWAKSEKTKTGLSETQRTQVEYWQQYREAALSDERFSRVMKPQKAQPQHWSTVHIGSSQYHLSFQLLLGKGMVGIELYIPDNKKLGAKALANLREFEDALGVRGVPFDAKKACGLRFYREGTMDIKGNPACWPELIEWQLDAALKVRDVVNRIGL